jgi:hypothetical protein
MAIKTLSERIGEQIILFIPIISKTDLLLVTLHAVEAGGIWIENEKNSQLLLDAMKAPAIKTPVLFIPYHQIGFGLDNLEKGLSLSNKAFGV